MDWGDTKMKTNPNSLPSTPAALLPYCRDCRDLSEWPERWMGVEEDLPPGTRLVQCFMPFLLHLAASGLSKRTIQNHVDNMWLPGGEIIRDVNEEPRLRKVTAEQLVRDVIHDDGGPLIHNGWEDELAAAERKQRQRAAEAFEREVEAEARDCGMEYTPANELALQVGLGDFQIAKGHPNIFVTHQLHESGQAHPAEEHFRGPSVAKAVRR
jgi:hypothetical protein